MYKDETGRQVFDGDWEIANYVAEKIRQAEAWQVTSKRLDDAHKYVQEYCMPGAWGKNVWHSILDDAIQLRKQLKND